MRIRSQKQVADFMCEYMAQECGRDSSRFCDLLNPVIKGIPVETHALLIQSSGAEHIVAIAHLRAHRVRILSSLGAVSPKCLYSCLLKNPAYLHLRRGQEFCRNAGVVVDSDMDFRP